MDRNLKVRTEPRVNGLVRANFLSGLINRRFVYFERPSDLSNPKGEDQPSEIGQILLSNIWKWDPQYISASDSWIHQHGRMDAVLKRTS